MDDFSLLLLGYKWTRNNWEAPQITNINSDIREEELDVSDEVPEIKSKLSFKDETEEVINRGQHSRQERVTETQVTNHMGYPMLF